MKFISIEQSRTYYLETEDKTCFRRCGGNWEQLYGESWETVSQKEEIILEEAFDKIAASHD